jgi:hypothetical protein
MSCADHTPDPQREGIRYLQAMGGIAHGAGHHLCHVAPDGMRPRGGLDICGAPPGASSCIVAGSYQPKAPAREPGKSRKGAQWHDPTEARL